MYVKGTKINERLGKISLGHFILSIKIQCHVILKEVLIVRAVL